MKLPICRALALLVLVLPIAHESRAVSVNFSSVDLDLDDPATGNNSFSTIFRVTEPGSGISIDGGPEIVNYEDENQTGMQVDLKIDFSDLDAPVVETIEFVGEPGDITHAFVGGSIDVEFNNGLVNIDLDATPNGVKGFLRTQGGPIPVNSDGSFVSGNTNLVARQGTVGIQGTITSLLGGIAVDETFNLGDTPLDQFNDSISAGAVNNVAVNFVGVNNGQRVYNVTVSTVLENTELPFAAGGFDLVLDITGTLIGSGEIRIAAIPEPASLGLLGAALATIAASSRRRVQ